MANQIFFAHPSSYAHLSKASRDAIDAFQNAMKEDDSYDAFEIAVTDLYGMIPEEEEAEVEWILGF